MLLTLFRFAAVMFTAIAMAAGFAHLLELPNKIDLPRDDYLTVQQIYRGWGRLGVAVVGALVCGAVSAVLLRDARTAFWLTTIATLCIALTLAIFFLYTFPTNQATANWTQLPENWQALRLQWEYSHAVNAGVYLVALGLLVASLLVNRGKI